MLGKLTWAAIPFDQPIPLVAGGVVLVVILAVLAWVVLAGHLPYPWSDVTARMSRPASSGS